MAIGLQDALRPIPFTKTVSVVSAASGYLLNLFGMQVGGPLEAFYGHGREGFYNIFNNLRSTAVETAPGMPAARRQRMAVGRVPFVYPRCHEEFSLLYEDIHNISKIDDPTTRDIAGENYIQKQSIGPGQRHANWRSAMLVGMLRDSLYLQESGNYWYPSYSSSGNVARRNFQLPAGNKDQLNMTDLAGNSIFSANIIDVDWTSPGANIPRHCQMIDEALFRRHGVHLRHIVVRGSTWDYVTNNRYVGAGTGIANPPFTRYEREIGMNADGSPKQVWVGQINKVPGVEWHIVNDGRELGAPGGETFSYDIEDGKALFLPEISRDLFEGLIGSEPIVEHDNGPVSVKQGFAAWTLLAHNPSSYQSFILDNFLPCPYVPGSWAYGTVAGF
jgi:hypothetical protein